MVTLWTLAGNHAAQHFYEALAELVAGRDVEFKTTSEFSIKTETSGGYLTSKDSKALTAAQHERIFNLIHILSMQRSPIKSEQAGADPAAVRSGSTPEGYQKPHPGSEGRLR